LGGDGGAAVGFKFLAFGEGEGGFLAPGEEFGFGDVVLRVVGVFPDEDCVGCFEYVDAAEEDLDFAWCWQCLYGAICS
jgi:hypothetical protein